MLKESDIKRFVKAGREFLRGRKDLKEFELYCSSAQSLVARLAYTSDIPCSGVEELKSLSADGFALRVVPRDQPNRVGRGFEADDLSLKTLGTTLERALESASSDPHFPGLPTPSAKPAGAPNAAARFAPTNSLLVQNAWAMLETALKAFSQGAAGLEAPGLVIGGDLTVLTDRVAVASSNFDDIRIDKATHFRASITALIEKFEAKATAVGLGKTARDLQRLVPGLGRQAILNALAMKNAERVSAGKYKVILGAQPVAEILNYMVVPSLTAGAVRTSNSAYHGKFGKLVMDQRLSLSDHPGYARGAISRRVTCEGIPAKRTPLISSGKLVGLLSNFYDQRRLAADPERKEKLGAEAASNDFPPAHGYRLAESGNRSFDSSVGTSASNVILTARDGLGDEALIDAIGDGIYVGRVWYTYPINGQRAGDFTCTVTGDSWLIRKGKRVAALAPNCLRLNANINQVFNSLLAAGRRSKAAIVWGSPEVFHVPELALGALSFTPVL